MHIKPASLLSCALAGIVVCGARNAPALSCATTEVITPFPSVVDVPTNTLVWCAISDPIGAALTVTDPEGAEVAGTSTLLSTGQAEILVFHPDAELSPSTRYEVSCPRSPGFPLSYSFTTGTTRLAKAPPIPDLSNVQVGNYPDEGWGASYTARFSSVGDTGAIVVVDLGGTSTLNPSAVSGYVAHSEPLQYSEDVWIGRGPCTYSWPEAEPGASTTVAMGAFDITGAFSGWSEPITITIPSTPAEPPPDVDDAEPADAGVRSPDDASEPTPPAPVVDPEPVVSNAGSSERPATKAGGCHIGANASSPLAGVGLMAALASIFARRRGRARATAVSAPRG